MTTWPATEAVPGGGTDDAVWKELMEFKLPVWNAFYTVQTAAGYKDNVALSSVLPEASPLVKAAVEVSLYRLPENGWEFLALGSFEDVRFLDAPAVDKEQLGLLAMSLKHRWNPDWLWEARAQYAYQNQIIDLATDQALPGTLKVEGHSVSLANQVWRTFSGRWHMGPGLTVHRQHFAGPLDDQWEAVPALTISRGELNRREVALTYQAGYREFDRRPVTDAAGVDLAGPGLRFVTHRVELSWRHQWGDENRWRSVLRVNHDWNLDNGSGFYNYRRWRLREQLRYRSGPWEVEGALTLATSVYPGQFAVPGGSSRRQDDLGATLRVERRISERLKVFLESAFDRSLSGGAAGDYQASQFQGGILVEF